MPGNPGFSGYFLVVETQKERPGMRFAPSIFAKLIEPINRRQFKEIVARHGGDAYDKSFTSWDHLLTLIFAQFSAADGLRGLEASWNANSQHHYHLGTDRVVRSTLSDANKRRPVAVFADTFNLLARQLDRQMRREGMAMLRLIDSTPVPLGKLCDWAKSNGRIRGLKMHVVYDPKDDRPHILDITDANVNDAQIGRTASLEAGATYVFDKGYCHYGWWAAIAAAKASFVTRPKTNMRLAIVRKRRSRTKQGDGFTILDDHEVSLASKGDSKLPIRLRRVRLKRETGDTITLLTNDLRRSAVNIATLYKGRWQIELLFRWIKQHLKIRKFLGNNDNAIRLQLFAAMIAYALLRIAVRTYRIATPILRFVDLTIQCLFERRHIAAIEKPPPIHASRPIDRTSPNQLSFIYV
jgi:putative transposase